MKLICAFLFFLVVAIANGSPCKNLTGTWRNELGSNMTIQYLVGDNTKITGQYNTSVESSKGAARFSSKISGLVQTVENGSLIAFNVLWNRGASLTAWVGQCIVCNGEERIFTTWLLRSLMPPVKKWMTTRINQDTFWRIEDDGPLSTGDRSVGENAVNSDLIGRWASESGDSVDINRASEESGSLGGQHIPVVMTGLPDLINGRFDGNETYSALGFAAASSVQIKGWSGHIYNPTEPNAVMETSWLAHAFSDRCNDPRKFVQYGMDNYTNIQDAAVGA